MQIIKEDLQQNQQLQAVIRKVKFRLLPLIVLMFAQARPANV